MKLKPEMRVSYEVAKERALGVLEKRNPTFANAVAQVIWPTHRMTSQGAGAAASRILKRMEKEGLVRWTSNAHWWGWVKA